ncbi:ATP-dependent DNA helicase RecG [Candidatus Xianfuyuplasma coldseepsis]|uniref:ATP-dependent DNA helicase RecG n=1 Tax=Candidatus Xianfuyuplasma coldseepsis TaxID=2782163 RepID=A0A7L7KTK9_9MOLU|nr:ATP-dependent DNA helicase RecG [Xianfuyuplasma coldseepsis]QMS85586.1 ATP-dependent DNA helicase RecG [Xianfuyuplasma coldseepsis]
MSRLESIKGIGPRMKDKLNRNQIYDAFDLIRRFPKRYEVYHLTTLKDAADGARITIEAKVTSVPTVAYIRKNFNRLSFQVVIEGRPFKVAIFNRDYLRNILDIGEDIVLTGSMDRTKNTFTATTLKLKRNFKNEIEPIYNIDGISDKQFHKFANQAMDDYASFIDDDLPQELQEKYKLIPYHELLRIVHQPHTMKELDKITRRIKYEELFKFQLKMQYTRLKNRSKKSYLKAYDLQAVKDFIASLPYELTNDQKRATNQIIKDIKSPYIMNRLLQGDVGSGKTVVAAITVLAVLSSGYQVAMMAPTEILAKQHYRTFYKWFEHLPYDVLLLTGKLTATERSEILDKVKHQDNVLLIGTHALFSDDVHYDNLGYVITDEQHRFGVEQRKKLREKGYQPDVLYMSATPIPRTLAISLFGDMDITTIREKPASRQAVETKLFSLKQMDLVYMLMEEELRKNHQIYVVTPLILESETTDLSNAQNVFRQLRNHFKDYSIGLMHSKIKQDNKEQVMKLFEENKINILVSTTVIEVGVDIANATMMVVFDSDRFGLSQLHQLRGRIGRSTIKSYCLLLHRDDDEVKERLEIMETTDDGFALSEQDLRLRGPGEFFGYRQSGDMKFEQADIVQDAHILEIAKQDALDILQQKDNYYNPKYQPLFKYLKAQLRKTNLD